MDNKKLFWGVVVVVLVLVWFVAGGKNKDLSDNNVEVPIATSTNEVSGTVKPVSNKPTVPKSLLSVNGNFQCEYEQSNASVVSKINIYVSGGKMRAEFRTRAGGINTVATLIVYDGYNLYSWKEGMPTGVVTQPKDISEFTSLIPADVSSAAVLGTNPNNANYDCHPWATDQSLLAKPSYVKFTQGV
jgi:hypothetical protein